ncbi:MAG: single-stranded DNA-binding protein [Treponema sp.]|nr:single-stranded DNA-binding protein [Treponema sp.]
MNNLNSVLIEGNMVRDPLLRSTPKGTPICTFSLASNRFFKQDSGMEREVSFLDVEAWGKLSEHCYNQGHKGRGVRVVGRLKQDRWIGSDGKNHFRVLIVAEHVEFRPEFKREGERFAGAGIAAGIPAMETGIPADPGPVSLTGEITRGFPSAEEEVALVESLEQVVF